MLPVVTMYGSEGNIAGFYFWVPFEQTGLWDPPQTMGHKDLNFCQNGPYGNDGNVPFQNSQIAPNKAGVPYIAPWGNLKPPYVFTVLHWGLRAQDSDSLRCDSSKQVCRFSADRSNPIDSTLLPAPPGNIRCCDTNDPTIDLGIMPAAPVEITEKKAPEGTFYQDVTFSNVKRAHYTACLYNVDRDMERCPLPDFVKQPPLEIKAHNGGAKFNVIMWAASSGNQIHLDMCHAWLTKTGADYLPQLHNEGKDYVQQSSCLVNFGGGIGYTNHRISSTDTPSKDRKHRFTTTVDEKLFYSHAQIPLKFDWYPTVFKKASFDSYHTHTNWDQPDASYVMRLWTEKSSLELLPVTVAVNDDMYTQFFGGKNKTSLCQESVHSCYAVRSADNLLKVGLSGISNGPSPINPLVFTSEGVVREHVGAGIEDFNKWIVEAGSYLSDNFPSLWGITASPGYGGSPESHDAIVLEQRVMDLYKYVYDPPADMVSTLVPFVNPYRWVVAVLDMLYPFIGAAQRAGGGKYPSSRFDEMRLAIQIHASSGSVVVFSGIYFHIDNMMNSRTVDSDQSTFRDIFYYLVATAGTIHCMTVLKVLPKVMGEKRITVPLYFGAGFVNLYNAFMLFYDPSLDKFFLLWSSMNVFIFVRWFIIGLSFSDIDWELNYTWGILAAATVSYSLSVQRPEVYYLLATPLIYGPFHEYFADFFGYPVEDTIGGNLPSAKNLPGSAMRDVRRAAGGAGASKVALRASYGKNDGPSLVGGDGDNLIDFSDDGPSTLEGQGMFARYIPVGVQSSLMHLSGRRMRAQRVQRVQQNELMKRAVTRRQLKMATQQNLAGAFQRNLKFATQRNLAQPTGAASSGPGAGAYKPPAIPLKVQDNL